MELWQLSWDLSGVEIYIQTAALSTGKREHVVPYSKVCLVWKKEVSNSPGFLI